MSKKDNFYQSGDNYPDNWVETTLGDIALITQGSLKLNGK
jgi:hypothetical protein